MVVGAIDHVGALFFTVIVIVDSTDIAGEPLSVAFMRRLHVWAGFVAVKLTLQFAGRPEPVTVGVNPEQVVPLNEQVIV